LSGINPRKGAIGKPDNVRGGPILEPHKFGHIGWDDIHKYGKRWVPESLLSAIEKIFEKLLDLLLHMERSKSK
jgi:hypothetical protein